MASAAKELEDQLVEVGNRLCQPPSSVDELLPLLDQVENFLSRVEQSPSKSMQSALTPSLKALIADELLRHPDVDVKVAVASCISEITRITAPDAPYDDDRMKDVFQLIVSSFENLDDRSSRSFKKRTMILETVAKVRSCVVMLDLECDGLIVEMFRYFLKAIRDYHPESIFSSMVTIMTLVLEESEDISFELISPLLDSVKVDNKEVLPIARKLGELVFESCATKLKPYLLQAKKSLGFSLDDYSKVIASICDEKTGADGHNDANAGGDQMAEESRLARTSSENIAQADEIKLAAASPSEAAQDKESKESVTDIHPGGEDPAVGRSTILASSNGVVETGDEDRKADPDSSKLENDQADQPVDTNVTSNVEPDDSNNGKIEKLESTSEQTSKKRGRKPSSLVNSTEPSDSRVDSEKEVERMADSQKGRSKEVLRSPCAEPSAQVTLPSENEKENIKLSSPKALESEPTNVAPPSPSGSALDEGRPKKVGRPKKKENLVQDVSPSANAASKKAAEATSHLVEVKTQRRSGKKASAKRNAEEKISPLADASRSEGGTTSDSDAKPLKQSGKKVDVRDNIVDASLSKKKEDMKKRGRGKATEKDVKKSPAKEDDQEMVSSPKPGSKSSKDEGHSEESLKAGSKRKRIPEKAPETIEYDESLVGLKVKVWWPQDKKFYEGVIDSFDSIKKKHKVLYIDGDQEILNLRKQRWEFVSDDSMSDEEQEPECKTPDPSPEMHKKKKAKANSEPSAKQGKMEGSRSEASSKFKGAATKSGRRSRDDSRLKDNTSKAGGKSEDETGVRSKDRLQKSSTKSGDTSRMASKSKDDDGDTLKTSTKSKQDTPKSAIRDTPKTTGKDTSRSTTKSKGKVSRSGNKSSINGSGKTKSGSVKGKETEGKEKLNETVKTSESVKGKSSETLKGQDSDKKSGKKRRRGAKS